MNEEWITDRPPTEEEVGRGEVALVSGRDRIIRGCDGYGLRACWKGDGSAAPIAWLPRPAPYAPPEPEMPDAWWVWRNRAGGWHITDDMSMAPEESLQVVDYRKSRADLAPTERTCRWEWQGRFGYWKTSCDEYGLAFEKHMKLTVCPRCSGRIERGES